jgi:hypothetical protein
MAPIYVGYHTSEIAISAMQFFALLRISMHLSASASRFASIEIKGIMAQSNKAIFLNLKIDFLSILIRAIIVLQLVHSHCILNAIATNSPNDDHNCR